MIINEDLLIFLSVSGLLEDYVATDNITRNIQFVKLDENSKIWVSDLSGGRIRLDLPILLKAEYNKNYEYTVRLSFREKIV